MLDNPQNVSQACQGHHCQRSPHTLCRTQNVDREHSRQHTLEPKRHATLQGPNRHARLQEPSQNGRFQGPHRHNYERLVIVELGDKPEDTFVSPTVRSDIQGQNVQSDNVSASYTDIY